MWSQRLLPSRRQDEEEGMNRKKIVLIGPVYPYRGGIAHNTSLLYRTLSKEHDVRLISYKMQYPKWLFKKEQKDFGSDLFKIEGAEFLIHTANPFNIIKVGKQIKKENPDLVIIQWWHPYFAPCYRILEGVFGKKIPILFVCHNVLPHESFPFDKQLAKAVLKKGRFYVVHARSDADDLLKLLPAANYRINPLPVFNIFKSENLSREEARKRLGEKEDAKLLLFFGFVREYKGLKYLLEALPSIKRYVNEAKLLVVGSFAGDKEDYLRIIREKKTESYVKIIDEYIPDSEIETYFAACDLVVLPYISATQSGIVQIAYGFEKPVVVTNVGGLPDVVKKDRTGYVVEPGDPEALAGAVRDFFENEKAGEMQKYVREEAEMFSWDRMRKTIEELVGWQ